MFKCAKYHIYQRMVYMLNMLSILFGRATERESQPVTEEDEEEEDESDRRKFLYHKNGTNEESGRNQN